MQVETPRVRSQFAVDHHLRHPDTEQFVADIVGYYPKIKSKYRKMSFCILEKC